MIDDNGIGHIPSKEYLLLKRDIGYFWYLFEPSDTNLPEFKGRNRSLVQSGAIAI